MIGRWLPALRPDLSAEVTETINQFQSDATEISTAPDPLMARATLYTAMALVAVALTWAAIATIDRIVGARGKIVTISPTIVVQPFEPAIIKSINVKIGDEVKAGSVLATLDPTFAEADVGQIESRIASLNTQIARLKAEQEHRPYTPTAQAGEDAQAQLAIWKDRQSQFAAQMSNFKERIGRSQSNIEARLRERDYLRSRLGILKEVETMRMALESTKSGSRLNSLVARDSRIEIERSLGIVEASIRELQHDFEATKAERDVFQRSWESKTIEEMVTKRSERDGLEEQLLKARRRQDMVELRPPVDGIVLEIAPRSVGSVINSAEALFKLVPLNALLEVEAGLEARQLGNIAIGDPVQIKLDAYPYQEHGMLEGRVKTISGDSFASDRFATETPAGSFYKVRIEIVGPSLHNIPETFRLIPGMPLTAEIKVGTRSVLAYLLRPILRSVDESMREP